MKVVLCPSEVKGTLRAIPSKSHAHRLLIAAALADAPCHIVCPSVSRDIEATAQCLNALGASVVRTEDGYTVTPADGKTRHAVLDCAESGSTLRFLLPVACALGINADFTGKGRLPLRPVGELAAACRLGGAKVSADSLPLTVEGKLEGTHFAVNASVSSQYVSGMLFALAATGRECTLAAEGEEVSRGYTEMTVSALRLFGKEVTCRDGVYTVRAGALHSPVTAEAEGDWSNAAFMLAAGALAGDVTVTGLNPDSRQRDGKIAGILQSMGAHVTSDGTSFRVTKSALHGVTVDVDDIPDLAPVLAVLMANAEGESVMTGVARLRDKESDRLAATVHNLAAMGIAARTDGNALSIRGGTPHAFEAHGFNDHRMVMSAAVAGLVAGGSVDDAEAVSKSYPAFFADLKSIGGSLYETL